MVKRFKEKIHTKWLPGCNFWKWTGQPDSYGCIGYSIGFDAPSYFQLLNGKIGEKCCDFWSW